METWIRIDEAAKLGISRTSLFRKMQHSEIVWRVSEKKTANGRFQREVTVESLPAKCQACYFAPSIPEGRNGEAGTGAIPFPLAGVASNSFAAPAAFSNLIGVSGEELEKLNRIDDVLDKAKAAGNTKAAKEAAATKLGVSIRKIQRWIKRRKEHGLAGLKRKERRDKGERRVADDKVVNKIQKFYLQTYQPTVRAIHEEIKLDYEMSNVEPPSYAFVRDVVGTIDPDLVAKLRKGEREYRNKFARWQERQPPPFPRMWVDGDHHPWDRPVIFRDGSIGRPWLTASRDICTKEILGFSVNAHQTAGKYSNRHTIALVIRQAILKKPDPRWPSYGLFENFLHDLGKDFRSNYIRAACKDLSIRPVPTRGYHGQSKPIERWFRTMETQLKHLPGYIGNNPENNPERQRIGTPRTWEEMRKDLMTIDQLEQALLDWIVDKYHHAESRALKGLSPIAVLEAHVKNGWTTREVRDERVLDLLLMERLERGGKHPKVMRGKIQAFGSKWESRFYEARELLELSGQEVEVFYDPGKIGEIYVYKDNRFICVAKNAELLSFGATKEDMKRKNDIDRHQERRLNERIADMVVNAQYRNTTERAVAERRHKEVFQQESQKIAAAAGAPSVPVLLPQFHQAAKKLRAVESAPSQPKKAEPNPRLEDLDLCHKCQGNARLKPSCGYCYKRFCDDCIDAHECAEKDEALDRCRRELEYEKLQDTTGCHKCRATISKISSTPLHCFDCLIEGRCSECGGSGAHLYCSECFKEHAHTNPGACHKCGTVDSLEYCYAYPVNHEGACTRCHGISGHRFCSECIKKGVLTTEAT